MNEERTNQSPGIHPKRTRTKERTVDRALHVEYYFFFSHHRCPDAIKCKTVGSWAESGNSSAMRCTKTLEKYGNAHLDRILDKTDATISEVLKELFTTGTTTNLTTLHLRSSWRHDSVLIAVYRTLNARINVNRYVYPAIDNMTGETSMMSRKRILSNLRVTILIVQRQSFLLWNFQVFPFLTVQRPRSL